jgi:hypothetical protein
MPPPEIRELDFSEFHPLDHLPGSARCRELPGGIRNHLAMAWEYKWRREVAVQTLCRIGRHHECNAWQRSRGEFRSCWNCLKTL